MYILGISAFYHDSAACLLKNGEIVVGNVMNLTLACDHRTIDGAVGAAFMNTVKQYIENPVTMLA